ncbi:MAG: 30S ribosomal protein S27ae [archaeon]|nr:30S ribosomal protein S27ae [archaeon]
MAKKEKEAKPKTKRKKHPSIKKGPTAYKIEGDKVIRKKSCPKCGAGVFMAEHAKRTHCGKCGFTEHK